MKSILVIFFALIVSAFNYAKATVLVDGTAADSIVVSGTSWTEYAHTPYATGDPTQTSSQVLSGGGQTLYAAQTWSLDTPMVLSITNTAGSFQASINGVPVVSAGQQFVLPTDGFNAVEFHLWTVAAGQKVGWSLTNLLINGNSVEGSWSAIASIGVQNVSTEFYVEDFGTLNTITADVTLHSNGITAPGSNMAQMSISGVTVASVPEPSSIALLGLAGLLLMLKKKVS